MVAPVIARINTSLSQTVHQVRLPADHDSCSCPWFSKLQGERGPCKHILAARLAPRVPDGRAYRPDGERRTPASVPDAAVGRQPAVVRVGKALLIALASRAGDPRQLAIELLIEGIADGRAQPGELAAGGWLKANRLSETLGEFARFAAAPVGGRRHHRGRA